MKKVFLACHYDLSESSQIVGNHIVIVDGVVKCVGGVAARDLVPGLTPEMGVVNVELTIEDEPFDGYTHEMYVYGSPYRRRLSKKEPFFSRKACKDGTRKFFTFGTLWLSLSGEKEYFGNHKEEIFKVYVKAEITDKKE